ncbi:hypothetical protein QMK19_26070 [Streptomyces sp. H10-C2]|uniref:hypothetical protein n=1 Tax=unclassified Streptomyces TaxID=2593676 RepID=UPI0024BA24A7|nr:MULTISPECIES: hypothetical protein [unclassified Streptomyces]MDJ0346053.1 hypothetical protein [Streptomyces sp. PH10-H1]MDJ0373029.1 hypothetical protein [Streptomyces sp. H10-C2]
MAHTRNRNTRRTSGRSRDRSGSCSPERSRDRSRGRTPRRTSGRRALRREAPSIVALLAGERDFAAMRRYRGFPFAFEDHPRYLRQMDGLLRSLASQGLFVTVTLFDPGEYAEYCADTGQDPDTPAARARYTADITAGGAAVAYTGQPVPRLIAQLAHETDRQAVWDRATEVLTTAGGSTDGGRDVGHAAFERASQALMRLIEAVGTGTHHAVCSVPLGDSPLLAVLTTDCHADGQVHFVEADALVFCTVLAAAAVSDSPGGIVVRTTGADGGDEVRGWSLHDGWPHPLTEAEVFNAYCTDAETGEPVPPEPGVAYRPGLPLRPPPGG